MTCSTCGSTDITAYSYDGGKTTTGYECRDCGTTWSARKR
jgi:DNA-directed RNA polymerase subunit RPC12/RpoP